MSPTPKPGVLDIAPYIGGRAHAPGVPPPVYKLSSNESALGPSPAAVEAFESARSALEIYPEGSAKILREAIGEVHGLNPERIVCGNGSDELLTMLANAYLRPARPIPLPEAVKSKFLPDSDYARAKSVDWGEMENAQKGFVDRYLAEVH